ncbi:UbiX family flavin prenyltransferase [Campylobacter avium]|uniref:UbiX family flavin prenyltransferase n=1 Tax=Campylobacter avium TaxID=522485 RepID=UPI00248D000C|nr:UbiX family flavin prenyltransferase [Campylobacter avium]
MKILVLISGASGVELGFYLLKALENISDVKTYCVLSNSALKSFCAENKTDENPIDFFTKKLKLAKTEFFNNNNLAAPISSGSFGIDKTIIAPCSINTLAQIYSGFADTLISRAAAVALKERKSLIIALREMPLSSIVLKQAYKLSKQGVIIAPPIYANYSKNENLQDLINFFVGKWLSLMDIEHNLYKKWE